MIKTLGTGTVLELEFLCVKKFCLSRTALRSVCLSAPEQLAQMQRYRFEPYPTLKLKAVSSQSGRPFQKEDGGTWMWC